MVFVSFLLFKVENLPADVFLGDKPFRKQSSIIITLQFYAFKKRELILKEKKQ